MNNSGEARGDRPDACAGGKAAAVGWLVLLLLALGLCAGLGRGPAIGAHAGRTAALHVTLLVMLWPLIRWLPAWRKPGTVILIVTMAARLAMLPILPSDDVHRYVWEGRVLAAGHDPYLLAPDAPELEGLRDDPWQRINHKDMTAIYPPGALLLFQGLTHITETPKGFKYVFMAVDLAVVFLLLRLLRAAGRREAWALLYALNPVILLGFAGEAHLDVFFCLFTVLALLAAFRSRWAWMFLALALAVQVKYIAVLFLPFVVTRENWKSAWVFPAATLACLLPFLPGHGMFTSLTAFSSGMHYNGSIHLVLVGILDDPALASALCAGLLGCAVLLIRTATPRSLEGGLLVMAALIACSPNVHFWYLAWFIPFLCFVPYPPLLVLCGTVAFTFATLGEQYHGGVWREIPWVAWAEYLPVYATVALLLVRNARPHRLADARPIPPPPRISVVVPVLNEAGNLPGLLKSLAEQGDAMGEVIVADAGSEDDTTAIAIAAGARLVQAPRGRGCQIAAGVATAESDAVVVAHADMVFADGVIARIAEALVRSGRAGGCAGSRFAGGSPFLRVIGSLNAVRARFFGVAFGDQCQFFLRSRLEAAGGYPALPIMEDVELSLRLRSLSPPLYLGEGVEVASRRWDRTGKRGHVALVLGLVATYGLRRWRSGPGVKTDDLYARYYGQKP